MLSLCNYVFCTTTESVLKLLKQSDTLIKIFIKRVRQLNLNFQIEQLTERYHVFITILIVLNQHFILLNKFLMAMKNLNNILLD